MATKTKKSGSAKSKKSASRGSTAGKKKTGTAKKSVSAKGTKGKSKASGGGRGKGNAAFMKPMEIKEPLQPIVGSDPLPRTEVVKRVWAYIKEHRLQDEQNKRQINADDNLRKVFGGKSDVTMFEMTKLINKNLGD